MTEEPTSAVRPWGAWYVLEKGKGYKVKRLEILPNESISMQYHNHRSEIWTVVKGKGKVIIDGLIFEVNAGEFFDVPVKSIHKITNIGKETLTAIEVQLGEITDETDIVRV
jgi:mannose-6-phosphate isomerase-like protein (cupin superfamily)